MTALLVLGKDITMEGEIHNSEFVSYEHVMFTELEEYNASIFKWEKRADLCLRNSNVVVLSGYGLKIRVRDGSLSIEYQRMSDSKVLTLNRGVHKIRNIVVTSKGGFITLDAISWLCEQNVSLYIIDWKGQIAQTLSPCQNRSARLAYLQYKAHDSGLNVDIARELVRYKAGQQAQALRRLPDHWFHDAAKGRIFIREGRKVTFRGNNTIDYGEGVWEKFEMAGDELSQLHDVELIRMAEARYAHEYWQLIAGIPINWKASDGKHIPQHWLAVSERLSAISKYGNASQATNPFHATLNFAYALLETQVLEAINIAGLSPEVGYLHIVADGGNLLAWDLMECFRPAVDAMVLDMFQKTIFCKGDFIQWYTGECRLNDELKRYVLAECRIKDARIDLQCKWLRAMIDQ
jgi:CRISPR-associated endonuclease Cas1